MHYEQWKEILSSLDVGSSSVEGVVVQKIKERLRSRSLQEYNEWLATGFDIGHIFKVVCSNGSTDRTLLGLAAQSCCVNIVTALIGEGADINEAYRSGWNPLFLAIEGGCVEVVRVLATKGADVNKACQNGWIPLFPAVSYGNLEIARILVDKGADVNKVFQDSWTPLYFATTSGHAKLVSFLINRGQEHVKIL